MVTEKKKKKLLIHKEPKVLKDFHNKQITEDIIEWIHSFYNHEAKKKALIIHGSNGIGKTICIKLIAKHLKCCLYYFDSSITRNKKWVNDVLLEITHSKGFFMNKRLLVIDDMDAFTNTNDYGGINEIVKLINPLKGASSIAKKDKILRDSKWYIPIVLICNNVKSNKFSDLTKECDIIHFPNASHKEMYEIAKQQGLLKRDIWSFIPHCDGDIRFFLNNVQFYKSNISIEKDNKTDFIYDKMLKMFEREYDDKKILLDYYHDPSMFPSLVNENVYNNLEENELSNIDIISENISNSDLISPLVHNKSYELDDIYAYFSVIIPIFNMKQFKKKIVNPIKFPVLLGKNAVIFANKSSIKSFYFNKYDKNIDHFIVLRNTILKYLNNQETVDLGIKYMLNYNINIENVLGSLKVKIFNTCEYSNLKNLKHKKFIKERYSSYF